MTQKDLTSMRGLLESLKEQDELVVVKGEVDPVYEVVGIQKSLEGGPALLFEKIKGHPNVRCVANIFAQQQRCAAIFDEAEFRNLKFKYLEAWQKPIPPRVVEQAPCQEIIVTGDINVWDALPFLKHTESEPGRYLFGGGMTLAKVGESGSDIGFKRMNFRGKDWCSLGTNSTGHLGYLQRVEYKGEKIPLTINICPPPATCIVGGAPTIHVLVPYGTDKLAIAGGLQGSPIDICKAKTVDAYAIANSEWVIEGYLTPEPCWESDEAERLGSQERVPFYPEWHKHEGTSIVKEKFEISAITRRKDNPIFFDPLAASFESDTMYTVGSMAYYYELGRQIAPGLIVDVNMPPAFGFGGVIYQVKKTEDWHDNIIKNILSAALASGRGNVAVAVDEDVDIYSADDILWAIWSRGNHEGGIFRGAARPTRIASIPSLTLARDSGLGIDATIPLEAKAHWRRAHYPVDKVNLSKWFSEAELEAARALQSEYAKVIAKMGS